MKTTKKKTAVEKFKEIENLIKSCSNPKSTEKKKLSENNLWALLSNVEII